MLTTEPDAQHYQTRLCKAILPLRGRVLFEPRSICRAPPRPEHFGSGYDDVLNVKLCGVVVENNRTCQRVSWSKQGHYLVGCLLGLFFLSERPRDRMFQELTSEWPALSIIVMMDSFWCGVTGSC
jgi:hypothetical protein